jgi:arginase
MLRLIAVPYHLGTRAEAVGSGPLRILETETAAACLIDLGPQVPWEEVNEGITDAVSRVRAAGETPLVLAGNCNSCLGTLGALTDMKPGIVWFDAHGDFHTRETSVSGSIEGMSLAFATERFVPENRVVLAGARDLDPGEAERVHERLCYIPSADLAATTLPEMRDVYVHIDIDVLDPSISPGVTCRTPGGLTLETLLTAIAFLMNSYRVAAFAITNYNPANDRGDRTRDIIAKVVEFIKPLRRKVTSR